MKKLLLIVLAVLVTSSAYAVGTCNWVVSPSNVVFGIYSPFGSGTLSATSGLSFECTPPTTGTVTFTTGVNSATYFPRYMATGGNLIGYNLYENAANTVVLGDGTGGTATFSFTASPANRQFAGTIYASTPLGADVPPGTYTDTVTAILSWDAQSSSVTFTVTTVVQAECTVSTIAVAFGNYDPVAAHAASPLDGTGTVNVYCTPGTSVTVSLGDGLYFAGGMRRMAGPLTSFLDYQLYREPARSSIWSTTPNTVSGTSTSVLTPIGGGLVVYGRVPGGQDVRAGLHADTVQATVNY
ncbi:MAG TPA: spore coat U domain-containing protein [Thermoanaerobaculia bacterium]|nr:spore coat U domain-containing protein [Thermoanaerobaculia bacterium]